jgi:type I restriction enzyme, S subunit
MISRLPSTWAAPRLADICQINPRGRPGLAETDEVTFVPMSGVSDTSGTIAAPETRLLREVLKGFTPFRDGDVLFAKITPCMENGKAAIARHLRNQHGYGSTEFHVIRPSALALAEWVFAIVRTTEFRRAAAGSFQGAAGQRRVPAEFLENFRIPLPPLSEQQWIVEILQEAEEIRRLRTEAEAKTAELIPAIFDAMFGDLYSGRPPFPVQPLSSIGELDRGKSRHRPRDEPSLYGGPYPFLQTGDVAQANGWITSYTQTYSEMGLAQSRLWPKGTLAITIAANIGATAILTFDACFPDSVVGFTPNRGVSVEFVRWWLLGYQKKLEIQAPQGAQKNINLEVLRAIQIPVPPEDLQLDFQAAIQNLLEQADAAKAGARSFAALSASLSAHAFSGQLTADWRELHQNQLVLEARDRDATLKDTGAAISRPHLSTMQEEIDALLRDRTDGIYSELNREQRLLLRDIGRMNEHYFSAKTLSDYVQEASLHRNPQTIEGHLAVLSARGLIVPVSREEQAEDTGEFVFGNAYRLPLDDYEPREGEEGEPRVGDHARVRELVRLAAQLEKERALK